MEENKKILFVCTEKEDYPRNAQIIKALTRNYNLIKIVSQRSSYPLRALEVISRLLFYFLASGDCQLVYIGFLGQPLMPFLRLLTRKPLILDAFVSVYDVLCLDRKTFKPDSVIGRIAYLWDKFSFDAAQKIIVDTPANAEFFSRVFQIDKGKFITVYAGGDEGIFFPREASKPDARFIVFYHGTFWPLHGVDYIIKAVGILADRSDIVFQIVGSGKRRNKFQDMAKSLKINNVEFIDWVSYTELSQRIACADICLGGHFSSADKAKRVVSGKTFLYLAMGKPVIVGENPATREIFTHGKSIYLCRMADEVSLAEGIIKLKDDNKLRQELACAGLELFKDNFSNKITAQRLSRLI